MSKVLVAYFSASGVTERAAKALAEAAGADIYEIRPEVPYTAADLDWTDKTSRSTVEMRDPDSRPAIAGRLESMGDYDVILLGFPIWWYTAPTIIKTFLESYDFSGKTIIIFATSGGSGLGDADETLGQVCRGAVVKKGGMLNGRQSREKLEKWLKNQGI